MHFGHNVPLFLLTFLSITSFTEQFSIKNTSKYPIKIILRNANIANNDIEKDLAKDEEFRQEVDLKKFVTFLSIEQKTNNGSALLHCHFIYLMRPGKPIEIKWDGTKISPEDANDKTCSIEGSLPIDYKN